MAGDRLACQLGLSCQDGRGDLLVLAGHLVDDRLLHGPGVQQVVEPGPCVGARRGQQGRPDQLGDAQVEERV
jgi:hypothetical protein